MFPREPVSASSAASSRTLRLDGMSGRSSGSGIGLRAQHHAEFLQRRPAVGWVEVHSENYFAAGSAQRDALGRVRADYPLSLHGVGLSIGSTDPLDRAHLRQLARLARDLDPLLVSEHLAWGSVDGRFMNDLLPLPFTAEALLHTAARVRTVQDVLGRQTAPRIRRSPFGARIRPTVRPARSSILQAGRHACWCGAARTAPNCMN